MLRLLLPLKLLLPLRPPLLPRLLLWPKLLPWLRLLLWLKLLLWLRLLPWLRPLQRRQLRRGLSTPRQSRGSALLSPQRAGGRLGRRLVTPAWRARYRRSRAAMLMPSLLSRRQHVGARHTGWLGVCGLGPLHERLSSRRALDGGWRGESLGACARLDTRALRGCCRRASAGGALVHGRRVPALLRLLLQLRWR